MAGDALARSRSRVDYYRRGIEINRALAETTAMLPAQAGRNHAMTPTRDLHVDAAVEALAVQARLAHHGRGLVVLPGGLRALEFLVFAFLDPGRSVVRPGCIRAARRCTRCPSSASGP